MNPPSPDSVPAVRTGERAWAALAILSVIVLVAGCAPTVVFYGDSAYLAAIVNTDDFESRMERAAADAGQRLVTEWDPSDALATAWLEQSLDEPVAPIVVLSPYFSLFASDVAARYPDISVIAMGGEVSQQANLTRVTFDRVPAFERAGALVRDWVSAGDDRGAGVPRKQRVSQSRA